ncbi:MAG: UDP-N-acetylmuramate dehydrogenase [Bacteroidales bacterium]|nr:UDP-N-acetylmuramate dehydrogenase [Bacteroidales bacterium]
MSQNSIPNTFGIAATADCYKVVGHEDELRAMLADPALIEKPCLILGGGSNMVFTRHFPGTIIHLENKGVRLVEVQGDDLFVEAAAGEVWDDFVRYCISQGWHGLENLVAIPGTVGAAPVQNVGAYGMEAKDVIHSVRAYELGTGVEHVFSNDECRFGYRDSIFKHELKGKYVVGSVLFRLHRTFAPNIRYKALSDALSSAGITNPTPLQLADTIAEVRWSKLPRPEETGSAGSFFKNPIVSAEHYERLKADYPDIVAYPVADGYKLAAGWLIERAGWKGRTLGRCGVYEKQALVLVNRGKCTGADVIALADAITDDIQTRFGVTLEKEAIII